MGRFKLSSMIVNVCPAAVTSAPPDSVWRVLTAPERLGEWTDAIYLSSAPRGPAQPGQTIRLEAPSFGRRWPLTIEVHDMDPKRRWINFRVSLPFGVVNEEHITLTATEAGGTLVRFN
jgi:uncharacterized protein YndB with AHSA1/START domain